MEENEIFGENAFFKETFFALVKFCSLSSVPSAPGAVKIFYLIPLASSDYTISHRLLLLLSLL